MFSSKNSYLAMWGPYKIDGMLLRYSSFIPRLYNYCKSLGFSPGLIMPSRAFCSDENQGYPIILITKHFGTFPFNHGRVGGIVSTGRHGPHADHGKDLVIIQASHVGYNPSTKTFGDYCRTRTEHHASTSSCGKISGIINWYQEEYAFAQDNIYLESEGKQQLVTIDNQLLNQDRGQGLFLDLDKIILVDKDGDYKPVRSHSTARSFLPSEHLKDIVEQRWPKQGREAIGNNLKPVLFRYKREIPPDTEGRNQLEENLLHAMPWIVSSSAPLLLAAQVNTQVEFDRTFRTLVKEHGYQGKNLVHIAGLNIDISPDESLTFPLTKFVPWAAFVQTSDGKQYTLEQAEVMAALMAQSEDNPDQTDLEAAIHAMEIAKEVKVST
ncbi:MAG: hypothetical protein R3354_06895 [Thiohalomonadales bacterium]|nr:hypothetical protein [Thiohalomonadales bacterium]